MIASFEGCINESLKGVVFNIQRYSIHDGPGIRTTVFLKGCPLQCFWCQNPESQNSEPEILIYKDRCTRCGQCVAVCPTGASGLLDENSIIHRSKCSGCGKCVEACPNEARSLVGKYMSVDEVMREVIKDKKFYENSGGGITLSGGEPTAQPEFALALLKACKEVGLHTGLDTCGYASWSTMKKLLKYIDLVLYDIKCMEERSHYEATGKSNDIILENAKRISNYKPIRVRVPMIPGFNDSREEVMKIVEFVKDNLGPVEIDLLPYNKWGESKYEALSRRRVSLEEQSEAHIEDLKAIANLKFAECSDTKTIL